MSDVRQGDGWWLGADGKWYPPVAPNPIFTTPQNPPPQTSGRAIAVMVLGIVGIVLLCGYGVGLIPAIVSLSLAPGARREIRQSNGRISGEGQVTAGVVLSWVTVGLFIAAAAIIAVALVVDAVNSSN